MNTRSVTFLGLIVLMALVAPNMSLAEDFEIYLVTRLCQYLRRMGDHSRSDF